MKHPSSITHDQPRRSIHWRAMFPGVVFGLCVGYLAAGFRAPALRTDFDLNRFGALPVLNGGRIKPIDTIARTSLLMLSGKQTLYVQKKEINALSWLADLMFRPGVTADYPVFEIDDPDVLGVLGIQQSTRRRFGYSEIFKKLGEINDQATRAEQIKPDQRTRFQTAVVNLRDRVLMFQRLRNTLAIAGTEHQMATLQSFSQIHSREEFARELERYHFLDQTAFFYPVPLYKSPGKGGARPWVSIGAGVLDFAARGSDTLPPAVLAYAALSDSWQSNDSVAFNAALQQYGRWVDHLDHAVMAKARFEYVFNYFAPFYRSLVLYLVVFLLIFVSWIAWPETLNRTALYVLILSFSVHSFGLISRMVLQGRPPVTNLYSSAIFVGWAAVLLGLLLEHLYRNGIGSMAAAAIGFITLIIAHHLASTGDTLEMMRAVLDSNFWLATHVVCITIGYSSTFVSGFLATIYVFRSHFDRGWTKKLESSFDRMVYGIVCFSTLFSFVGTILGGIWADQSWGRFWGWDPKENGALLIVLWNVFILHARWGKLADGRNLMLLAIVGNIVTALSWFGVNMLGVGLHSYGFIDKAFIWLMVFIISQLTILFVGTWPVRQQPR